MESIRRGRLKIFRSLGVLLNHYPELVQSLAMVKKASALANRDLGALKPEIADAIIMACVQCERVCVILQPV